MSKQIDVRDLPARLDETLASAAGGEDVIFIDGATPRARLVPLDVPSARVAGLHARAIQAAADFDAPLSDDFWAGPP